MKCEQVREQLDAYVSGTLPPERQAPLEEHLATCDACRADLAAARSLAPAVAALPRSLEPGADLWPAIERKLDRRRLGRRPRMVALAAAAAILLITGSSAVTVRIMQSRGPGTASSPSAQAVEAGYVDASAQLLRALDAQRDRLAPATVATLQRNLAVIDAAIAESRAALAGDPGNRDLAALLWAGYRQKVALLQQVTRLVERS